MSKLQHSTIYTIIYKYNIAVDNIIKNKTPTCLPVKESQIAEPRRRHTTTTTITSSNRPKKPTAADIQRDRTMYSKELADYILYIYSNYSITLNDICNRANVDSGTFFSWVQRDKDGLKSRFERAKKDRSRVLFAHGIDAEIAKMDEYLRTTQDNKTRVYGQLAGFRIKFDMLKYRIERGNPAEYGPRVDVNHTVHVDPRALREQAWEQRQRIDAQYRVHDTDTDTNDAPKRLNDGDNTDAKS